MSTYKIIYGGQMWIMAENEEEAYQKFWREIQRKSQEGSIGLIVEEKGGVSDEL